MHCTVDLDGTNIQDGYQPLSLKSMDPAVLMSVYIPEDQLGDVT